MRKGTFTLVGLFFSLTLFAQSITFIGKNDIKLKGTTTLNIPLVGSSNTNLTFKIDNISGKDTLIIVFEDNDEGTAKKSVDYKIPSSNLIPLRVVPNSINVLTIPIEILTTKKTNVICYISQKGKEQTKYKLILNLNSDVAYIVTDKYQRRTFTIPDTTNWVYE